MKRILLLIFLQSFFSTSLFAWQTEEIQSLHAQLKNAKAQNNDSTLASIYLQIAKIKTSEEFEQDSIFYYLREGLTITKKLYQDSLTFEYNGVISYWYSKQKQFDKSIPLLKENIAYAKNQRNDQLSMRSYLELAKLYSYYALNKPDSVIYHTERALTIAEQLQDTMHILLAKSTLATTWFEMDTLPERCLQYFSEAYQLTDGHAERRLFKTDILLQLARLYKMQGDHPKAIDYFWRSIHIAEKNNSYGWLMNAYQELTDSYEALDKHEKALMAHRIYLIVKDSLNNQERLQSIERLKATFENERKENQITQLQIENEQQKTRSRLLIGSLIGTLLFLLLGGLAIVNYRRQLTANKKILVYQKQLDQLKNKLYTNITHEFRTPLTVIMGMVNQIKGKNNEKSKTLIQRNSQNLLRLVNRILDLQKLEVGALKLNYEQADIILYLKYLVESYISLAETKNIRLVFYGEAKELLMDFDADQLNHIVTNLLSNAIKFTNPGGRIVFHAKQEGAQLELKVKDNGIGISKEHLPHIFDRFYQIENNITKIGMGTGIGLAHTKELVELMNGQIKVESDLNSGTTLTILLPIHNNAPIKTNIKRVQTSLHAIESTDYNILEEDMDLILIVEDNRDVVTYIRSCLKDNYKIEVANNGAEGIEKALTLIPDLIISDVMMPIKTGLELCNTLKGDERTNHIPIILLTAKAKQEDKIEGLEHGADAFLAKPFDQKELEIRMLKLLELRRQLQQTYSNQNPYQSQTEIQEDPFIQKVREVIEKYLDDEDFNVHLLSRAVNMSRMQVHRKLKALIGKSATEFIRDLRLHKAQELLRNTTLNISEIAYAVGFSTPSYFSKVFTEKFGHPPTVTRK